MRPTSAFASAASPRAARNASRIVENIRQVAGRVRVGMVPLSAITLAGNPMIKTYVALAPAPGTRLAAPPTLRWTAVTKASYYNVQLFKGSKILSAWPTKASFKLARTWRFRGRRHRLAPGRYRWYVWPGYGPQSANHYGKPVGHATFVIK